MLTYRVEADDRIGRITGDWDMFGELSTALTPASATGHAIWRFIVGTETRTFYRQIFDRVRATRQPATRPFRCDSPTTRRT